MPNTVRFGLRTFLSLALLALIPLSSFAQSTSPFNLPAQPLAESLRAVGAQLSLNVMVSPVLVDGKQAPALKAQVSAKDALTRLLAGTGLEYHFVNDQTVVIREKSAALAVKDPPAGQATDASAHDAKKEDGKKSSQYFRMAQATAGQGQGEASVEKQEEQTAKKKPPQLEEVIVTGSRIPRVAENGPQQVQVYSRDQIDQSGQTSVADFVNTLPSASISSTESASTGISYGSTTVQLRGLPVGTTLVLIDGRRAESSGLTGGSFFDLNNIPLAAVERIEVVADGSSAIYGSDAIAGVVNIILKKKFNELEVDTKYGGASGIHESDSGLAWGKTWERGSISIVGSYQTRSELEGYKRALTASNDYTAFGGPNNNYPVCSPGNIFSTGGPLPGLGSATYAAVPAGYTGKPSIQEFQATAGTLNSCSIFTAGASLIPTTHRTGVLATGSYELTPGAELFAQVIYSHVQQYQYTSDQGLLGLPGFTPYTVSASNPYNPFGVSVGVSELFPTVRQGQFADTDFYRPLVGARGVIDSDWRWELAAWQEQDSTDSTVPNIFVNRAGIRAALNSSDPASALDPFVAGSLGSQLQSFYSNGLVKYSSRELAAGGLIRGPILHLPAGPIELAVGGEYDHDRLFSDLVNYPGTPPNTQALYHRNEYALFGEARVPILATSSGIQGADALVITVAGRYDHYSDFGGTTIPQFGLEWRPLRNLLVRGTYARAFKAPSLTDLYTPQTKGPAQVIDPLTGLQDLITLTSGGNPSLSPQTGRSHTLGIAYLSEALANLQLSITQWTIDEYDAIQSLSPIYIVNNASLFPGRVIRGPTGAITDVIDTEVNFGKISVSGLDYELSYKHQTPIGTLAPTLSISQTYRYSATLLPNTPSVDGVSKASDNGNWAPRWKGALGLAWTVGTCKATVDGRYVGRYDDYDSSRQIGNFWLLDANLHYRVGQALAPTNSALTGLYVEAGGVNLLNRLPQFSDFQGGLVGYDPAQADIRGRFLYARLGMKW